MGDELVKFKVGDVVGYNEFSLEFLVLEVDRKTGKPVRIVSLPSQWNDPRYYEGTQIGWHGLKFHRHACAVERAFYE